MSAKPPVIALDDVNTTPDSRPHATLIALLQDAWTTAPTRRGPDATFHGFTGTPDRRIDWILLRGATPSAARTLTTPRGTRYPSDHFPVVAEVQRHAPDTTDDGGH